MGGKPRPDPGAYRVVLADPPWTFSDLGTRMAPSYAGQARQLAHYPVQSLDGIKALGGFIRSIVAADAFLFLWVPNILVLEGVGTEVGRAWGFEPKQLIPWVKTDASGNPRLGGGHYTRVVTEQLCLFRRGEAKVKRHDVAGVVHAIRGRHSAKPDESYQMIERLARGPYVELYARRAYSPKWSIWGNQVDTSPALMERVNAYYGSQEQTEFRFQEGVLP